MQATKHKISKKISLIEYSILNHNWNSIARLQRTYAGLTTDRCCSNGLKDGSSLRVLFGFPLVVLFHTNCKLITR